MKTKLCTPTHHSTQISSIKQKQQEQQKAKQHK